MTDVIERQVDRFAPGFRDLVLSRHTMDTAALEAHDRNAVGGDISAGALGLRQPWPAGREPAAMADPGARRRTWCSASTPPARRARHVRGRAARTALADDAVDATWS